MKRRTWAVLAAALLAWACGSTTISASNIGGTLHVGQAGTYAYTVTGQNCFGCVLELRSDRGRTLVLAPSGRVYLQAGDWLGSYGAFRPGLGRAKPTFIPEPGASWSLSLTPA